MSAAQTGRRHTEESKAKISASKMGHAVSDETKAKIAGANAERRKMKRQMEG